MTPNPSGPAAQAALVHLPRHLALKSPLPREVLTDLVAHRRSLAAPETASYKSDSLAAAVRTVSLVREAPKAVQPEPDAVVRARKMLCTWVIEVTSSPSAQVRERARLGIFAALKARRAFLECSTVGGWKSTVAEFAESWLAVRKPDENRLQAVSMALLGHWLDLLDEYS